MIATAKPDRSTDGCHCGDSVAVRTPTALAGHHGRVTCGLASAESTSARPHTPRPWHPVHPLAEATPPGEVAVAPTVVPAGLVADGEQIVLAIKPGGGFILLVSLPVIFAAAIGVVIAVLLGDVVARVLPPRALIALCGAAIVVRLVVAILQWLARLYVLTDRRVIRVKGVLHVQVFQCPLGRVQNTFLSLSLPERLLGMGTIFFATAGTGGIEAGWLMINRPTEVHEIVVEWIRRAQRGNGGL